jgi:excisionase family DNA binding protein
MIVRIPHASRLLFRTGVHHGNHDRRLTHINRTSSSFAILRHTTHNDEIGCDPVPNDRYQTVKEVADRMKVGEATVRHWIRTGDLRAIDIGKGWRIADADLERFLTRHQTVPRNPADGTGTGTEIPAT